MADLLIDTDILIDHLRGHAKAKEYLHRCWTTGDVLHYSVITRAELFAGMRPNEEASIRALLASMHEVFIDSRIAEEAGAYWRQFGKSHGLLLPDALIAASAKSIAAKLITLNTKHFSMKGISIIAPYRP